MTDRVDDTLRSWRQAPFVWGGVIPHIAGYGDCLLSIGEYLAALGWPDVASDFRGSYDSEAGALVYLNACGGAVGLVERVGMPQTLAPMRGDVAVIENSGGGGIGALCTGDGFALRLERGVIEVNRRFITIKKAWSTWVLC